MKGRIVSIDVFRGLMLLSMTFNHLAILPFIKLPGLESWMARYVYGPCGFLSNSEGFFFLAGLISGIVYSKLDNPFSRIKGRLIQMYVVHIGLLASFTLLLTLSPSYLLNWEKLHSLVSIWIDKPGIHYFLEHPFKGFAMGSLFLYAPPFFDILPIYMLFLAATPFILKAFASGKMRWVLMTSITLWFASQYTQTGSLEKVVGAYLPVKLGWFHPLALQLLFVSGLSLGYAYVKEISLPIHNLAWKAGFVLISIYTFLKATGADLASAHHLGILRLMTFGVKLYLAYVLHGFFTSKHLALLGKYSLQVFAFHVALVYSLVFFLDEIAAFALPVQILSLIFALCTLWIPVYFLERKRLSRSKRQSLI